MKKIVLKNATSHGRLGAKLTSIRDAEDSWIIVTREIVYLIVSGPITRDNEVIKQAEINKSRVERLQ